MIEGVAGARRSSATAPAFEQSILQQLLVSLVAIKIVGLVLILDPSGLHSFELPKSLFSRAMEWLIAGVLLIALLRYGPGIIPRARLHFAVGALVLVNVLSAVFAENRYIALFGEERRYLGLTFVVDMAVLYVAVAVGFRRLADWALLAGIVAFTTAVVLGYAAIQYLGLDPMRWNVDSARSPFSTLGNSNTLGRYISLIFGAAAGVATMGRGQVAVPVRLLAGVFAVVTLAAAALAPVRGTLVAIGAVLCIWPVLYLRARGGPRRTLALATLAAIAVALSLAVLVALTPAGARLQNLIGDSASQERLSLFDSAIRAAFDRPLLGSGPDNFAAAHPRYRQPGGGTSGIFADDAHNWLLQTAATTGALGLLALGAAIVMSVSSLWTYTGRPAGALAPALLLASVGYWVHASLTIASASIDWFPYLVFGAAATSGERVQHSGPMLRRLVFPPAVAVIAVMAIAGSLTGTAAFMANRDGDAASARVARRPEQAVARARSAIERDPGRAVYWYWLGRAHEAREVWSEAAAAYAEAASRAPYERAYWEFIARSLTRDAQATGRESIAASAIAAARTGTEIDPNEPRAHVALAETAYTLGDYDLSLRAAVSAISVAPRSNYDALVARAAARASDLRQARGLLEEALRIRDTASLHLALARLALRMNDVDTARIEARRTLELAPGNADAQRILRVTGR